MVALVAVVAPAVVDAALAPPPIEFDLSPPVVGHDESLSIRLAPAPRWADGGPLDVYIMWATTGRAAFLRPDGAWSPVPVAFWPRVEPTSGALVREWRRPEPRGDIPLAMVVVPSGADPLVRSGWRFRPVLRSARVATDAGVAWPPLGTAAALLGAAVMATLLVAILPRPVPRRTPPERVADAAGPG